MHIRFGIWLLIWTIAGCVNRAGPKQPSPGSDIQKILIARDQVFDLSGYGNGDKGTPYNLFDENAFVDPRYDHSPDAFIPVTNCQPTVHPAIYFHGAEGNRVVIDLLQVYALKEIYLYDRSGTADRCRVFTGSLKKWDTCVSFLTASGSGNWGWRKMAVDAHTRFVMIQFSSYETAITEMVLYGTAPGSLPAPVNDVRHKGFTKTPLKEFLGVNYIMENEPALLVPFHYSRLYNFALDYDNDSTRDEKKVRFNMLHYGFFNKDKKEYVFDIDTLKNVNRGNIWYSIRGVSGWMSRLGFTDKDRPLNHPQMNSEDPVSYSRHAAMMWNLAAFFGYQKVDTTRMSMSNNPRQSGRGSMHIFENGNEEDATWVGNRYCSPYEYYAQSTADWDGDEGRIGPLYGIHHADSGARLMMSGLIGLDTNRVRVYRFLSENLRNDRAFIWTAGIQYHYYAERNGKGISPEQDSMRLKLTNVADCSYRIAPGVPCILGENGYDKSPVSRQCTPLIPGHTAAQSQGILLLRSINATFFSGFDAYILYWLRDGVPENDPGVYLTSGLVWKMPDGKTKIYPGWYYISTLVHRLGNYVPDAIVQERSDGWVYRYRHVEKTDSVAYLLYKPTVNGSQIPGYVLNTGRTLGQAVKISFTENSATGTEEPIAVTNDHCVVTTGEKPVLIVLKEAKTGK